MEVIKTIGTNGRDYSTIAGWEADLDNSAIYSSGDDAVGECYNDSVFDENIFINGGSAVGLNSVLLTVAASERHNGTAGTGARMVASSDGKGVVVQSPANCTIDWLEIDGNGHAPFNSRCVYFDGEDTPLSSGIIQHCIIHGYITSGIVIGIDGKEANSAARAYNNLVYDLVSTGSGTYAYAIGIRLGESWHMGAVYDNTVSAIRHTNAGNTNSVYGISIYNSSNKTSYYKNNLVTDITTAGSGLAKEYSQSAPSYAGTASNGSTDSTSPDGESYRDLTVVFSNPSSGNFNLESGSDTIVFSGGTTFGASLTLDLAGRDRVAEGDDWSLGSLQYVSGGSTLLPINVLQKLFDQQNGDL